MRRVIGVLTAFVAIFAFTACKADIFAGRGKLLSWKDGSTEVQLVDDGSFDLTLELRVSEKGRTRVDYVIDKSTYGTLRFIRYHDDLLVANGPYIFAAYSIPTGKTTYYWELPFTLWEGEGKVLGTYKYSTSRESMRANFPMKREPRQLPL